MLNEHATLQSKVSSLKSPVERVFPDSKPIGHCPTERCICPNSIEPFGSVRELLSCSFPTVRFQAIRFRAIRFRAADSLHPSGFMDR